MPVTGLLNGTTNYDPTNYAVEFAFMTDRVTEPGANDWHAGTWMSAGSQFYAMITVGSQGVVLAKGYYYVWCRVLDSLTTPTRLVGTAKVV